MNRGNYITGHLAVAVLVAVTSIPMLCAAQKAAPHSAPARPAPMPQQHESRPPATAAQQEARGGQQQRHAGDWLRQYKDLAPDEQEQALQNDPDFKRLPPARQQKLRERLQNFSNLPPQRQLQILNRMDTWAHLTREQKQDARQIFKKMRQLPPDRRQMVHTKIDELRAMPADQRERLIDSDQFKATFSDQERQLMRDATRLPLAPPDSGDQPGQSQESQPQSSTQPRD
jgi:hypothetical protein